MTYLVVAGLLLLAVIGVSALAFLAFGSLFPDFDWPDDESFD